MGGSELHVIRTSTNFIGRQRNIKKKQLTRTAREAVARKAADKKSACSTGRQ
jgi:hypothetical protein